MKASLTTCPYCGSRDLEIVTVEEHGVAVRCTYCGAVGPWTSSPEAAILEFNTRTVAKPKLETEIRIHVT
jgi:DNA-directed RNA polymerase subunit RPC12/RpoP